MLHRELRDPASQEGVTRHGRRLDHAEGTSQPMPSGRPEPEPRFPAPGNPRTVDRSAAANPHHGAQNRKCVKRPTGRARPACDRVRHPRGLHRGTPAPRRRPGRLAARVPHARQGTAQKKPLRRPTLAGRTSNGFQANPTGNWGGLRDTLLQRGIDITGGYLSETAGNPSGGTSQAIRYADQREPGVDLDLGRLGLLPGGAIHVTLNSRAGRKPVAGRPGQPGRRPGDLRPGPELPAGRTRLRAVLRQRPVRHPRRMARPGDRLRLLALRPGRPPALLHIPNARHLRNPGRHPAQQRLHALSQPFGARASAPCPPANSTSRPAPTRWTRPTATSATASSCPPRAPQASSGPVGDYKLGVYYDTSSAPDPFGGIPLAPGALPGPAAAPLQTYHGRYGLYALAAQQVYRFTAIPPTRSAASQPSSVRIARRQSREVTLELNYTAAIHRGVALEPVVQHVINPGALRQRPNALVLSLR